MHGMPVTETSVVGRMKIGNIAPWAGFQTHIFITPTTVWNMKHLDELTMLVCKWRYLWFCHIIATRQGWRWDPSQISAISAMRQLVMVCGSFSVRWGEVRRKIPLDCPWQQWRLEKLTGGPALKRLTANSPIVKCKGNAHCRLITLNNALNIVQYLYRILEFD